MIIKIDLEKAFNSLEWGFIKFMMEYTAFRNHLVRLIMSCISTSNLSIIINGNPSHSFKPSRGIRQRDPISPYLFILCMECLSILIEHGPKRIGTLTTLEEVTCIYHISSLPMT